MNEALSHPDWLNFGLYKKNESDLKNLIKKRRNNIKFKFISICQRSVKSSGFSLTDRRSTFSSVCLLQNFWIILYWFIATHFPSSSFFHFTLSTIMNERKKIYVIWGISYDDDESSRWRWRWGAALCSTNEPTQGSNTIYPQGKFLSISNPDEEPSEDLVMLFSTLYCSFIDDVIIFLFFNFFWLFFR